MRSIREGAPESNVFAQIVKYDGNIREPQWMDVEQGTLFDSTTSFLHLTLTIKKISLRLCVM